MPATCTPTRPTRLGKKITAAWTTARSPIVRSGSRWRIRSAGRGKGAGSAAWSSLLSFQAAATDAGHGLATAAGHLDTVVGNVQLVLATTQRELFSTALNEIRIHLESLDSVLREKYPKAIQDITETADKCRDLATTTQEASDTWREAFTVARTAGEAWKPIPSMAEQAIRDLDGATARIENLRLDSLADRFEKAARELDKANADRRDKMTTPESDGSRDEPRRGRWWLLGH